MTRQDDRQALIKLKTFLATERREIGALQAPDDFSEHIQKLAADYVLREQATSTLPMPEEAPMPAATSPPALPQLKPRFQRGKTRLSPAMGLAVAMSALIICAIMLTLPSDAGLPAGFAGLVEVKAAYAAGNGIDVNEGFIISASEPLDAELVGKALKISPSFDYQLQQEDDATYRVLPTAPLEQNTVYHLSFDPERAQEDKPVRAEYSWSFQTEVDLELLDCSPTDTARDVPVVAALTLTFNKEITEQAADFTVIEPQAEGVWRVEGANLHFTPAAGWADDTLYTLTLAEGLPALDGSALPEARISRFQTERVERFEFSLAALELAGKTFMPQETPAWLLTEQQENDGSPYAAALFGVADSYNFAAALAAQSNAQEVIDVAELELLAEYELIPTEEQDGCLLSLPESLQSGFYVLDLNKQGYQQQLLFQVSSLSAYVALGGQDRLFWLHDGAGQPVSDAQVTLWPNGPEQGRSDKDGVALLAADKQEGSEQSRLLTYCVETERESLVLVLPNNACPEPPLTPPSWALYTAQSCYQPGDTVDFFGVYDSADENEADSAADNQRLTLRLKAMGANMAVLPYTVEVSGGAFSGSLTLPGLRLGRYELALYDGEFYVGGSFIQVTEGAALPWQALQDEEMQEEQEKALQEENLQEKTQQEEAIQEEQPAEQTLPDEQPLLLLDSYAVAGQEIHGYAAGEAVELGLYRGAEPLARNTAASSLFVLAGESVLAHQVTEETTVSMPNPSAYPAAFQGWAIYYQDGRYYESAPLYLAGEQPQPAVLQAEWLPAVDTEDGEACLSLRLNDADGQPLAATLNVNILAEAPVRQDDFAVTSSNEPQRPAYQHFARAEHSAATRMALEPADQPRTEEELPLVEETAAPCLFATLATDEWGEAELAFTPPELGREWYLSWRAYDAESQLALSGVELLDLRLPLNVEYVAGTEFQTGDAPQLRFRATGTAIATGEDIIGYELDIAELDFRYSTEALAESWCVVDLPQLPTGSYELRLRASANGERQELYLPINVRQESYGFSRYIMQRNSLQASTLLDINSKDDVTLVFCSPSQTAVLADTLALGQRDARRLDYKLAAMAATDLLREYGVNTGAEDYDAGANLALYQRESGGLAPLPRSSASSRLSALAAPLINQQIDSAALAAYLRAYYEQAQEPQEQAMTLYGLASLAQPVLLDIDRLAAEQPDADTRLYLALAYLACGNGAAAKALAVDLLAEQLQPDKDALLLIEGFANTDAATAYLALLAQIFELPQAGELYDILLADSTPGYAQTLALAQILAVQSRALHPESAFSYRLGGLEREILLSGQGFYSLVLPARQLAELSFSDISGEVDICAIYSQQGWPMAYQLAEQPLVIERDYEQQNVEGYSQLQVWLDISLPQDAAPGYYRVEDTLLSGLRFNALDTEASSLQVGLFAADGDTVSFDIHKGEGAYHGKVVYTAWVYTPGLYQAAAPRIYAIRQPQLYAVGENQQVDVE